MSGTRCSLLTIRLKTRPGPPLPPGSAGSRGPPVVARRSSCGRACRRSASRGRPGRRGAPGRLKVAVLPGRHLAPRAARAELEAPRGLHRQRLPAGTASVGRAGGVEVGVLEGPLRALEVVVGVARASSGRVGSPVRRGDRDPGGHLAAVRPRDNDRQAAARPQEAPLADLHLPPRAAGQSIVQSACCRLRSRRRRCAGRRATTAVRWRRTRRRSGERARPRPRSSARAGSTAGPR